MPGFDLQEFWPLIIEKAFAKYCGSYAALDGGVSAWAMEAMTGDKVFKLSRCVYVCLLRASGLDPLYS